MKYLFILLFLLAITDLYGQRFKIELGLGPSLALSKSNVSYSSIPSYKPTITIEDLRSENGRRLKEIDWIKTYNYFGFEPSLSLIYNLNPKLDIGLDFIGRHRNTNYEVYLPVFEGLTLYSHRFELNYNFILTSVKLRYKINNLFSLDFNAGFNYPLNKLSNYIDYNTIINEYEIKERVFGQIKGGHHFLNFTLNPVVRLAGQYKIKNRYSLGFSIEKQLNNEYGSILNINNNQTGENVVSATISGNDIVMGLRFNYLLFYRNSSK